MDSRKQLLLIDDEVIVRRMLASFLEPYFKVQIAADAFETIALLFGLNAQQLPSEFDQLQKYITRYSRQFEGRIHHHSILKICPDIIIADIKMPKINGFQLVHILRKYLPTVPVFMITGFEDEGYDHEVSRLKINEILAKPFSPMILLEKIKKIMHI